MLKFILPLILILVGTGTGIGAGIFLRPDRAPEPVTDLQADALKQGSGDTIHDAIIAHPEEPNTDREYVKLNNQFVIPIVEKSEVSSLVVMSLSVEVLPGFREEIFEREPKLRDSFLQVLFDHANIGGFKDVFTRNEMMEVLRSSLVDSAIQNGGSYITDVLILEMARQDY